MLRVEPESVERSETVLSVTEGHPKVVDQQHVPVLYPLVAEAVIGFVQHVRDEGCYGNKSIGLLPTGDEQLD
jgi:hypothetical protein